MDFTHYSPDIKRQQSTINPADLHNHSEYFTTAPLFDQYSDANGAPILPDLSSVDSAVDLTSFQEQQPWHAPVKLEPMEHSMDQFLDLGESSQPSNTPSPSTDMIFSNANSPGDFVRDLSQTSSPETNNDVPTDAKPLLSEDGWFQTPDAIRIPQAVETPQVYLYSDKTKTRAETQIKVQLVLDPLDDRFEHIHFPRKTLAKPKLLASADEKKEIEGKGEAVYMDLFLVCATAVEKPDRLDQALRRARGQEPIPRRQTGIAIPEMDKDDPAHPQNGGEVLICEGCKERERKRYDRKKKRAEDEVEWWGYEHDRVIMINEKEYKKWKDVESGDRPYSSRAKQVEFAMRIACYCRHQEEKSPVGYRVIFTFKDAAGNFITQHTSEIFQITDDHKNKEVAPEALPRPLTIPQQYVQTQYGHGANVVPLYQYPVEGQYATSNMGAYSQPATPIMSNFQSPTSPLDAQFPQSNTPTVQSSRQAPPTFPNTTGSSFSRPPTQNYYDVPLLSPTNQVSPDNSYLPRPISMDNFNYTANMQYQHHQGFASAPPSAVSTPINLSRPASPSWDQGPGPAKKRLHCVYFYVDDE